MEPRSEAQPSIKIGFYSVAGALLGGVTGSWASTAFGESAAFDFVSTLLIFGVGMFLGAMVGTAFHGSIRARFGMKAGKRTEWTGRLGIAAVGLLVVFIAEFVLVVSMGGEFQLPSLPGLILALGIGVVGLLVILTAVRPTLVEIRDTE